MTPYLREHHEKRRMESPIHLGRIWRITWNDFEQQPPPPGRVLIPGCGRAPEVSAFVEQGYRVTAIDERKQRDGRPLQYLGTYDPRHDPPALNLDVDGIEGWVGKGAQLSDTVRSLVNRVRREGNTATAGAANG